MRGQNMPFLLSVLPCRAVLLWLASGALSMGHAQVATNITHTAGVGDLGTTITGTGFVDITGGTRPNNGSNLFHSFGEFSVGTGDTANFVNDSGLATQNILSRVTGGNPSNIFGTLQTTGFPGADLYLLNPSGVHFGPTASLKVEGGFHVTTADFIELADGVRFDALPSPNDALLTTAPPAAFGFLDDTPAPIVVTGGTDALEVTEGQTISLVGGDITMKNGTVYAPGGQINLISTASPGEVAPTFSGPKLEANVTSTQLGKITLSRDAISDTGIGDVDAGGTGGGAVVIRGGEFVMEGALVLAQTFGDTKGVGVDIRVSSLDMRTLDQEIPASIDTTTFLGLGDGGDVFVETDTMRVTGAGFCQTCIPPGILAETFSEGDAGNINVKARQINLETGGTLSTSTSAQGKGGDLDVEADSIALDGENTGFATQSAPFFSASPGDAGDIDIKTNSLTLINGAQIRSPTFGPGRGGDISIQADRIFLSGRRSSIASQSAAGAIGDAGEIQVTARHLEVHNGATINTLTAGRGQGGNMFVTATDDILLVGDPSIVFTGLSTETKNDGDAGNLTVTAGTLEIRNNARIEASTLFDNKLTGAGQFSGRGGDLTVTASDILISGAGAGIVAKSTNNNRAALSGDVHVTATDSIRLENQGTISVETVLADAGDIDIQANELLLLRNNSSITTSVAEGAGSGGDIRIDPVFTILDRGSRIVAQAREGAGGNISIVSDFFFASPDSVISASSELGIDGVVEIDSPDTDLNAGLIELPADFFDVATLLTQGCAAGADLSRLVVRKYEVLPDSPAALRVPPPRGPFSPDALGSGFEHSRACDGGG